MAIEPVGAVLVGGIICAVGLLLLKWVVDPFDTDIDDSDEHEDEGIG